MLSFKLPKNQLFLVTSRQCKSHKPETISEYKS